MLRIKFNSVGRRVLLFCVLYAFSLGATCNASYILVNDGIISEKVSKKVESMGTELYEKTSISVYVALPQSLNNQTIIVYEQNLSKDLKSPYVLLTLAKNEHQVDIISSDTLKDKFDKEEVLSPFPWSGTIVPLLAVKKNNDQYNAAILNGYADIVERIAASYDVKLQGAIGSTNKNILHYFKFAVYAFLIFIFIKYILIKLRRKNG